MKTLPDCTAHAHCSRDAFLLLDDRPVCRVGYDESGRGILPQRPSFADLVREVMGR